MMLDESAVQDFENCIVEFDCNPFDPSNTTLRTLQSGAIASVSLVQGFEMALKDAKELLDTFLEDRLFSRKTWRIKPLHVHTGCDAISVFLVMVRSLS